METTTNPPSVYVMEETKCRQSGHADSLGPHAALADKNRKRIPLGGQFGESTLTKGAWIHASRKGAGATVRKPAESLNLVSIPGNHLNYIFSICSQLCSLPGRSLGLPVQPLPMEGSSQPFGDLWLLPPAADKVSEALCLRNPAALSSGNSSDFWGQAKTTKPTRNETCMSQ